MKVYNCILLLLVLLWAACSDDKPSGENDNRRWTDRTVVVVLPQNDGLQVHWQHVFTLLSHNVDKAFENQDEGIRLNFEVRDEAAEDMASLAKEIAMREDVYAVIGGLYSENASVLASTLCRSGITFMTLATTEELIRAYSATGNLWAMTETDITQCEVLLSKVVNYGGHSVGLIAKENDIYGKTFIDWFAFQAKELGLEVKGIYPYDTDLRGVATRAAGSGADFVICAPSAVDDIGIVVDVFDSAARKSRLLFSDMGYGEDVISRVGRKAEGIEGVCFGADPETGFDVSFRTFFGVDPTVGAAQLYDASMLLVYAAWHQHLHPDMTLQSSLRSVVDGRDFNMGSWMGEDMRNVVDAIAKGGCPYVRGASGPLDFDSKVYTNVLSTTYCNYLVYNGKYIILDYNTADGGNRTDATLAGWNWKASQMQNFGDVDFDEYAPLTSNRALLVATSTGWSNYRHQADVLALYQLLKRNGYTDDQIILVCEDDIAYNADNPSPGEIRVKPMGENVYQDVEIDYRLSDLSEKDICDILAGDKSERLDKVLDTDEGTNILVFWSGHGEPGSLCWNTGKGVTGEGLGPVLRRMHDRRNYRKLCMFVETCYSGSVLERCSGIPGMLFFTAADAGETSKADVFNASLGVWMSNRFTATLTESLAGSPSITFRELYTRLFINTVGSHVMVYNNDLFGSLYRNTMEEFLRPAQ